ncbi:MAG: hypothetical protein JXA71_13015 [Chitinispirillaceae bacterium]|nr:hypothetical protein [Chitinispirillaceae bacterium]
MKSRFFRLILPAITLMSFYLHCSLDNLAGGSGAGNPGGSVTVALRAEVTLGTMETAEFTSINDRQPPIEISDQAGLKIAVSEILLNIHDFRFMLDPEENPEKLLRSLRDRSPLLSCDTQSLILTGGGYTCNGLTGKVVPDPGMVHLPVAKYTGMMLSFKREQSRGTYGTTSRGQLYLSGTFSYYGKTRRIIVDVDRSFSPFYKFAGGIFTLSATDTTHLELRYNPKGWFQNIDIKRALDRGTLQFNQNGDIVIGGCSDNTFAQEIELTIQNNFIASGKLVLY